MNKRSILLPALLFFAACGAPGTDGTTPQIALRAQAADEDPALELSEQGLFFGQVCGDSEADRVLTLSNVGGDDLTLSQLRLTGEGFSIIGRPALPLSIPPGGARAIRIRFIPGVARVTPFAGNLRIVSNDPAQPVIDVALSGLALPGSLRVTPRQFDFGTLGDGQSRATNLTLRTSGACPVSLSGTRLTGNLSNALRIGAVPGYIGPGEVQTVNVRLVCNGQDNFVEANLRFLDDDGRAAGSTQILGYCSR